MTQPSSPLLTRKEAAAYLGIKPQTLDVWASTKRYNLRYIKVGRLAKYHLQDLDDFIIQRTIANGEI